MELEKQVANHEARIINLEQAQKELTANYRDALRMFQELNSRVDLRIQEVKEDLRAELSRMDEKIASRMDQIDGKLDEAIDASRRSAPPWVGPLIGAILAVFGWILAYVVRG